jgi:hypothetical protein
MLDVQSVEMKDLIEADKTDGNLDTKMVDMLEYLKVGK